jgi:hypothetical protein
VNIDMGLIAATATLYVQLLLPLCAACKGAGLLLYCILVLGAVAEVLTGATADVHQCQ